MAKSIIIIALLGLIHSVTGQSLLFKSGFEDTVRLSLPVTSGGQWYQFFSGTDLTSGYQWPNDLPIQTPIDAYWTFKVPDTAALSNYAQVKIDTNEKHSGDKSLYMEISDYDNGNFGNSMAGHVRCEYRLNLDTTLKQAYLSYWMKVQPNLYSIMQYGTNRWRIIMEWFETGQPSSDYRWGLKPRVGDFSTDSTSAYWQFYQDYQFGAGAGAYFIGDTSYYSPGQIPLNRWFKVEVFWKQAMDSTGRIWASVDGQVIFDEKGRNMNDTTPSPLSNWQIFKLYVDEPSMDDGLVYQWIDDIEIWDTIPSQTGGIPDHYLTKDKKFVIYPNPADKSFYLKREEAYTGSYNLIMLDALGKQVFEKRNISISETLIHTDRFQKGIYYLKVMDDQNQILHMDKVILN
ncbi:MAG: T9SS type A sorting domain-containing protein [Brumimicrobium sp.]|nr:T9SS type A sorting domain-containing protein [Brumimicrobium sp.]